jgi:4-hydroxy-tetrahydrodipicolinate reductase
VGKEILACALADKTVRLAGCVEYAGHPSIGYDAGACIGQESAGVALSADFTQMPVSTSVIIDFTSPDTTASLIDGLMNKSASLVIGTTGIDGDGQEKIKKFSETHPVVFSPNMSLGVNLLFYLTELLSKKLGDDFDIEIIEAHHRFKKDSPSGTAKKLGEIAACARGLRYDTAIKNGRVGMVGERTKKEIGMHAVRGGDIIGDHTILFAAMGERLELRHMAHSRETFARGAVMAAKWLSVQKPGLYSMREVLGL